MNGYDVVDDPSSFTFKYPLAAILSTKESTASTLSSGDGLSRMARPDDVREMLQAFGLPLASIWACQAGKDVYVEKPVSHNIFEGRQLVRAARKYGCMVQAGTQARSNPDVVETVAWVTAGNLGKSKYARGTCYKPRVMSIGGRLGYDDDGETPNTQLVYHAYDGPPMP